MEERNLIVFLKTHTISSQNLFHCDICDYCYFQVVIKTHEKRTWRRENLQFFLKHTLAVHFVKTLFQCHICDYCCFQVVIKTHEKQTCRRETSQFFLKHILAVHFVKTLFQCDICDYCCFQVDIKSHEKQTWRRETLQFFSKHTLSVHRICSNVIFVTIAVFKLLLKHMKSKHVGEKPYSFSENTQLQFILERTCSSVIFVTIADFKTHEKKHGRACSANQNKRTAELPFPLFTH